MAGFNTAITGIRAATADLDVTGNNIANSSTVGFKSSRTEFADLYATAVVGAGTANTPGSGVLVSDIAQNFSGGTTQFTDNNLDLAINGSGFFQLNNGRGDITYTRAGAFELDKDGFVVSKSGEYLQGYGLDAAGNRLPVGNLQVNQKESPPKATENIEMSFNINSAADPSTLIVPYSRSESRSYTFSNTIGTFDSLGNQHTIRTDYVEQRPVNQTTSYDLPNPLPNPTAVTISGVTLNLNGATANFGQLATRPTGILSLQDNLPAAANDLLSDLKAADPRILGVEMDTTQTPNKLNVIFKSDSTEYGSIVTSANLTNAQTSTRSSQETHRFNIGNAPFVNTPVQFEISGVPFSLGSPTSTLTADNIGAEIVAKQSQILDANPDIDAVSYDSATSSITITYKATSGDVDPNTAKIVNQTANGVFDNAITTAGNFEAPDQVVEGDNSYQGVYRMYGYLNPLGERPEPLNIGKAPDPGSASTLPEVGPVILRFNPTNGILSQINGQAVPVGADAVTPKLTIRGGDPADPSTLISLDLAGTTQFSDPNTVKGQSQDGYTKGDLTGVSFTADGVMVASYSNNQQTNLGVVALATFENQAGLQNAGDTQWRSSRESGDPILNPPGTGLNGSLRSSALEQSNVDLSTELVRLIEAQRNFQANSKTLETLNNVTQNILQI